MSKSKSWEDLSTEEKDSVTQEKCKDGITRYCFEDNTGTKYLYLTGNGFIPEEELQKRTEEWMESKIKNMTKEDWRVTLLQALKQLGLVDDDIAPPTDQKCSEFSKDLLDDILWEVHVVGKDLPKDEK